MRSKSGKLQRTTRITIHDSFLYLYKRKHEYNVQFKTLSLLLHPMLQIKFDGYWKSSRATKFSFTLLAEMKR